MKTTILLSALSTLPLFAETAVTVYNKNFAVVRDIVPLSLQKGINDATYNGATLSLEPDSVILRDLSGKAKLSILEQSYRKDTASQGLLLSMFQGETIDFLTPPNDRGEQVQVKGKIVRSGYSPGGRAGTPIIELDGKMRFSLPGQPLFPTLGDNTILEPALSWKLASNVKADIKAELSYLTGGLSWQSSYNLVLPEKGTDIDMVGWVTFNNRSGKTFNNASIKLMAGDVNKIAPSPQGFARAERLMAKGGIASDNAVTQKAFDEFHLYSLPRKVTLRDKETKQIEFMRGEKIKSKTIYTYDGAGLRWQNFAGWNADQLRGRRNFGGNVNKKIKVEREFANTKENGLGIPLPAGKIRFYRQDNSDGRIEFTGDNVIDHTPQGEDVKVSIGDSFDLIGDRKQVDYQLDNRGRKLTETYEIILTNRKKEAVTITVQEQMIRGGNWEIIEKSDEFKKLDARRVTFDVPVKPDEKRKVSYTVRYTW